MKRIKANFKVGDRVEVWAFGKSFGTGTVAKVEYEGAEPQFTIEGCVLSPVVARNSNLFKPKEVCK